MGDDRPEPQRTGRTTGSSVLTPPTGLPVVPDDPGVLLEPPRSADVAVPRVEPAPVVVWATPDVPAVHPVPTASCLCGHGSDAHAHWRPGSDCGLCGAAGCSTLRRRGGRVRRLLRSLRLIS